MSNITALFASCSNELVASWGRSVYDFLYLNQVSVVHDNFVSATLTMSLNQLGIAIRSIPRIWNLIGHCLYCAILFPEFKDMPMLHYFSAFVAGFGGGFISSVITLPYGKGAPPIGAFVDNSIFIVWTMSWWVMNHSPFSFFSRLHRQSRIFRIVTLLGLTLTRTNTIMFRINAITSLLPESNLVAAIFLPSLSACGGRFLSDVIRAAYGFWGFSHRYGWGDGEEVEGEGREEGQMKGDEEGREEKAEKENEEEEEDKIRKIKSKEGKRSASFPEFERVDDPEITLSGNGESRWIGLIPSLSCSSPSSLSLSPTPSKSLLSTQRPSELSVPSSSFRTAVGFAALYIFLGHALWPKRALDLFLRSIASMTNAASNTGSKDTEYPTPVSPLTILPLMQQTEAYAVVMLTAVAHSLAVEFLGSPGGDFTRPIAVWIHKALMVPMASAPIQISWPEVLRRGGARTGERRRGGGRRVDGRKEEMEREEMERKEVKIKEMKSTPAVTDSHSNVSGKNKRISNDKNPNIGMILKGPSAIVTVTREGEKKV